MIHFGCGHSPSYSASVALHLDSLQSGRWIGSHHMFVNFLSLANWRPVGHNVLCSLLWCMWEMNSSTSISVVAAPKGRQSLCSAAGQANKNSEVLWLYQTSWLCVCEFCGLQRSSAPHLKQSYNCSLFGVQLIPCISFKKDNKGVMLFCSALILIKCIRIIIIYTFIYQRTFLHQV